MKSVTFSKSVVGGEGEPLKEGQTYSLNDASADRWIRRGVATVAESKKRSKEEKPDVAQEAAAVDEAKSAEEPEVKRKSK